MRKALIENRTRRTTRQSLYQEVADIIRDRITDGTLAEGAYIDELALADELNVSRTPVREALKLLAFEGLVDLFPNQGCYVAKITADDAKELIELLAQLEGFAGELACRRASDEMLRSLARTHDDMVLAYRQGNRSTYFKLNQFIHDDIVASSGNRYLIETHQRCTRRLRHIRYMSNLQSTAWEQSVADHEAILLALSTRSQAKTRKIMTKHAAEIWDTVCMHFS